MIRSATAGDVPFIVELGRALHDESPHYSERPYYEPSVSEFVAALIETQGAWVAVHQGRVIGYALAITFRDWVSGEVVGSDVSVYVEPAQRGGLAFLGLIRAMEQWWTEQGAVRWTLGVSTDVHEERTLRAYERMGYRPAGRAVQKAAPGSREEPGAAL